MSAHLKLHVDIDVTCTRMCDAGMQPNAHADMPCVRVCAQRWSWSSYILVGEIEKVHYTPSKPLRVRIYYSAGPQADA